MPTDTVETVAKPAAETTRQAVQDAGWRTLTAASDLRSGPGTEGQEITIAWYPEFKDLGVPSGMIKNGRNEPEGAAAFLEVYRYTGRTWLPVD